MGSIGLPELLIIGLAILLLFGAKRIQGMAKGIGKGIRDFTDAKEGHDLDEDDDWDKKEPQH